MKYYVVFLEGSGYLCKKEAERGITRYWFSFEEQPIIYRTEAGAHKAAEGLSESPVVEEVEVTLSHKPPLEDGLPGMEVEE